MPGVDGALWITSSDTLATEKSSEEYFVTDTDVIFPILIVWIYSTNTFSFS